MFFLRSLEIKSVVQRRLEFLKAVRFGSYVLNELVWRASCEGFHTLGRISVSSEVLENQTCDEILENQTYIDCYP